jgi:polysaccharide deacetylase 2 family uncharacterized protein YibQ
MKFDFEKILEPYCDANVFRTAVLSFLGFGVIMFGMAGILLPPAKSIPIEQTISLDKSIEVGSLKADETKPQLKLSAEDSVAGLHESTPYGLLPIKSPDGTGIFDAYKQKFVQQNSTSKLQSIVLFDVGLSKSLTAKVIEALPSYTTLVISPYAKDIQTLISTARSKGFEIWLYVPFKTNNTFDDGGIHMLSDSAPLPEIEKNLLTILGKATGYTGIVTNSAEIFSKNKTVFKQFQSILETRGVKQFVADLSAEGFVIPKEGEHIIVSPLTPKSLEEIQNWKPDSQIELAPLSATIN